MKRTLDDAVRATSERLPGLVAAVLSVSPDGLIAWCWSREDKPEVALGFAALDRAATICLEGLGASHRSRHLLLTTADTQVVSWPLYDEDDVDPGRGRLVLTLVFDGELLNGMIMVYGLRVRAYLRAALDAARSPACMQLRAQLVEFQLGAPNPCDALRDLADAAELDLHRLERLEQLGEDEQQRLLEIISSHPRRSSPTGWSVHSGRQS